MPCRAANICRLSSQPTPQCLWITDDVLAEAFNRFARVSNANRTRTDGRRYGSNVPGPLEAHRRSAKRRMGVAAVAVSGPPPGQDFGALFGFGGRGESEGKIDGWKYEPPGVGRKNGKREDAAWMFGWHGGTQMTRRKKDAWETFLDTPGHVALDEAPADPVTTSRAAFEELLASKDHLTDVQDEDLAILNGFLQTTADEPAAHNTLRLAQWLNSKTLPETGLRAFSTLVLEKARLQTLEPDETSSLLVSLLSHNKASLIARTITDILDASPEGQISSIYGKATKQLLDDSIVGNRPMEFLPPQVQLWLRCLRSCYHLQGWHYTNGAWRAVYDLLLPRVSRVAVLTEHLATLKRVDLARVVLRHWAPQIMSSVKTKAANTHMNVTDLRRGKLLTFTPINPSLEIDDLLRDFEDLRAGRYATRRERVCRFSALVDLLSILQRHNVPHIQLSHDIFAILLFSASEASVHGIFCQLRRHRTLGVHESLANRLVHHFLAKNRLDYALSVFISVPTLPLSECFELPLRLARSGEYSAFQIWRCLQRQTQQDIVPGRQRPAATPEMSLKSEYVDLVHLVAVAYAGSVAVRSRVAFRRVWECYLFLRDRRAPITSLMTRAMVTAGVIRPLKEWRRVSTVKFRYILGIVEAIEGKEVAEALDRAVYKLWSEDILPKLRLRHAWNGIHAVLGQHDTESRQLQAARQRLVRWRRRSRAWLQAPGGKKKASSDPFPAAVTSARKQQAASLVYKPFSATSNVDVGSSHCHNAPVKEPASATTEPLVYIPFGTNLPPAAPVKQAISTPESTSKVSAQSTNSSKEFLVMMQTAPVRRGLGYDTTASSAVVAASPVSRSTSSLANSALYAPFEASNAVPAAPEMVGSPSWIAQEVLPPQATNTDEALAGPAATWTRQGLGFANHPVVIGKAVTGFSLPPSASHDKPPSAPAQDADDLLQAAQHCQSSTEATVSPDPSMSSAVHSGPKGGHMNVQPLFLDRVNRRHRLPQLPSAGDDNEPGRLDVSQCGNTDKMPLREALWLDQIRLRFSRDHEMGTTIESDHESSPSFYGTGRRGSTKFPSPASITSLKHNAPSDLHEAQNAPSVTESHAPVANASSTVDTMLSAQTPTEHYTILWKDKPISARNARAKFKKMQTAAKKQGQKMTEETLELGIALGKAERQIRVSRAEISGIRVTPHGRDMSPTEAAQLFQGMKDAAKMEGRPLSLKESRFGVHLGRVLARVSLHGDLGRSR